MTRTWHKQPLHPACSVGLSLKWCPSLKPQVLFCFVFVFQFWGVVCLYVFRLQYKLICVPRRLLRTSITPQFLPGTATFVVSTLQGLFLLFPERPLVDLPTWNEIKVLLRLIYIIYNNILHWYKYTMTGCVFLKILKNNVPLISRAFLPPCGLYLLLVELFWKVCIYMGSMDLRIYRWVRWRCIYI